MKVGRLVGWLVGWLLDSIITYHTGTSSIVPAASAYQQEDTLDISIRGRRTDLPKYYAHFVQ
jgi:hypothetical protein